MVTIVRDLLDPTHVQMYSCTPREAVIAAYAQSLGDWNTWQYAERYSECVVEGNHTVACGDFCAMKLIYPTVSA
jgi:hypothetical protein